MFLKISTAGVAVFAGLLASAACSGPPSQESAAGAGTSESGGAGGSIGGGRGGTSAAHAGSLGKGGRSSDSGGSTGESSAGASSAGTNSAGASSTGGGAGSLESGGAGGEAGATVTCPGCASGFCLSDGSCVDCLPSSDHCPTGTYCTDQNRCAAGCKNDGTSCASGSCAADHNCAHCINDSECKDGFVCGDGQCAAACTAAQEGTNVGCGTGLACCSLHCSDLQSDPGHCGTCGTACGNGQFCGVTPCSDTSGGGSGSGGAGSQSCVACHDTTLAGVCAFRKVIVILDTTKNSSDGNRTPGRAIAAALEAHCTPSPTLLEEEQDAAAALNWTTGRPVSGGGELLVVAGGPYFQDLEGYVEAQGVSPLYGTYANGVQTFRKRSDDSIVVSRRTDTDNLSHDFFVIQFMRDPKSGSLVLNAQGFWLSGTNAATFQWVNGLLPVRETLDKSWYAYEWTDLDGDMAPDLNEITLQSSG